MRVPPVHVSQQPSCHLVDSSCIYGRRLSRVKARYSYSNVIISPLELMDRAGVVRLFFLAPCLRAPGFFFPGAALRSMRPGQSKEKPSKKRPIKMNLGEARFADETMRLQLHST